MLKPHQQNLKALTDSQNHVREQYVKNLNVENQHFNHSLALELLDECLRI